MFGRDPCKRKGHDWRSYGWSVCGFGPYRFHVICAKCGVTALKQDSDVVIEDETDGDEESE